MRAWKIALLTRTITTNKWKISSNTKHTHNAQYTNDVKQAFVQQANTQYSFIADVFACRFVVTTFSDRCFAKQLRHQYRDNFQIYRKKLAKFLLSAPNWLNCFQFQWDFSKLNIYMKLYTKSAFSKCHLHQYLITKSSLQLGVAVSFSQAQFK